MRHFIDSVSRGVPAALTEVITLGRTLPSQADDILAHFDRPGTSTAPPRRSMAGSSISAAQPSASGT